MRLGPIRQRSSGEEGFALITVMLALMALTALSVAIVDYGIGSQNLSKRDQNWNAAFSAAEAGVNDYLNRINNSPNYSSLYGTEPGQSPDPANPAMTATTTTGADWAVVPGTTDAKFRYWIDSDLNQQTLAQSGSVTVTATGKVGNAARTVETQLRVITYLDFLYYTDLEIIDPALIGQDPLCAAPHHAYDQPGNPGYDPTGSNPNGCLRITFRGTATQQDVINGPLHTNDRLRVRGNPQFNGPASTSNPGYEPSASTAVKPGDPLWLGDPSGPNSPNFAANPDTTNLVYSDPIPPLPSNAALKTYAGLTAGGAQTGGCAYVGPTTIEFESDGTMEVWSPRSVAADVGAGCPLGTSSPANGPLPSNGVIYVDRYTGSCSGGGNGVGYPRNGESGNYSCKSGDVFVEGSLNGQVTIGADNDIYVTDDLLYHDKPKGATSYQGTDILGLIANRFVTVYHPVEADGSNHPGANDDIEIDAAILSVLHSFYVQNWNRGAPLGDLTVFGAIAQEYRGAVGLFNSSTGVITRGYNKNYNYDNRLQYLEPPYFLNPTATAFQQSTFKELTPRLS